MKRGDVVLIRFPFTDLSSSKVRPAIIISSDDYNRKSREAIFMLITSNVSNPFMEDLLIDSTHSEFNKTGLKKSSLFKIDRVITLQKSIAMRKLGEAGPQIINEITARLKRVLAL